jgi:hypothetical protein
MMLIKNHIISFLTVIFILVGCDSDIKNLDNTADVSTETPTHEGNTSSEDEGQAEDTDQNSTTPTEETVVRLSKPVIVETKPSNWYIRLIAEDSARALKSSSSQLGELEESDAVQVHALKALTSFSGSYLDIVFVNPDGIASGDYKSNFHVYDEEREDQWSFTVKTDDPNAEIQLSWQGIYVLNPYTDEQSRIQYKEYRSVTNPLIKYMKLVDTINGKEIAAMINGKVEVYTFNMNGQNERVFKWVVENEEVALSSQTNRSSRMEATKVIENDTIIVKKTITSKKSEMFDLSKPPMMK